MLPLLGGYEANATWVDGVCENDYVLEAGTWKIGELRTNTVFSGAYETDWEGAWIAGVYEGEASAQGGAWKLDRLDLSLTWAVDYSAGWASAAPFVRTAPLQYDVGGTVE